MLTSSISAALLDHLEKAVLSPWLVHSRDTENGGFFTQLDRHWTPYSKDKLLIAQARTIYSFAAAHHAGLGGGRYLEAGQAGAAFLLEHFRDDEHGGWYWSVGPDGTPRQRQKRLRGHLSVIYALTTLYQTGGNEALLRAAVETYDRLEEKAHDPNHGGYYEFFKPDWSPGTRDKSLGAHLDALEATLALANAAGETRYKARADELTRLVTYNHHITETFRPNWQPAGDIVHYGDLLNAAWFFLWAAEAYKRPAYRYRAFTWLEYCLDTAWDDKRGGFAHKGNVHYGASDRRKVSWVQARGLAALARVSRYSLRYQLLFRHQMSWCLDRQHDTETGGWFAVCDTGGDPVNKDKTNRGHAIYEITQAILAASKDL